ncbi:MAG: branched-chain amino acid transaminase [Nitrososphaerota archaeon]|nr:branched-chain amino acid transaminase [Nitrososphaerales archaeon]MDW8045283.1 branched-chain amino acid transaminase [Nitrososphaerota archaeon]
MEKTEKIWLNGRFVDWEDAKIHVLTHSLHYGVAVFEGLRCYKTEKGPALFRGKDHIRRLFDSAKIYMMKIPYSQDEILQAVKDTIRINKVVECYVRPIVYYGYGEMGLNPSKNPIDVAIAAWPWGAYLGEEGLINGIRCKISSWRRIDGRIMPSKAKISGNYANSILAKLEALKCGYDEAIMLNLNGTVAEGSGENIFIVKDGILMTPPLDSGALPGITRDSVMKLARDMNLCVIEKDITREDLFLADEVFFTGTAAEITPIREIDNVTIGRGTRGPITEALQKKFYEVVRGKDPKYYAWLDFID